MRKIQEELRKFFQQFGFFRTSGKYDVVLMIIYPIYVFLHIIGVSFIYSFSKFYSLFILIFIVGLLLSLANNKVKEISEICGVMCILSIVNMFTGSIDYIVYAIIYGAIAYGCYKLFKENESVLYTENNSDNEREINTTPINNEPQKTENTAQNISSVNSEQSTENYESNAIKNNNQTIQFDLRSINLVAIWQPLAAAIIMIFTFFQDWLKLQIEELGLEATYSISSIKNLANSLSRLASMFEVESGALTGMTVFINILHYGMYVVIIAEILFIITKIIDNEKYKVAGMFGSMITIIITVVVFIIKLYVGGVIKEELSIDFTVFTTTIFPVIAFVVAIWQIAVMGHSSSAGAYGLEVVGKKCRVCGTMNHEDADKCGKCGTSLSGMDIIYKK